MSTNNQTNQPTGDDDQSSFSSALPIFVDQKFGWVQTRPKMERETIEQYVKYFNCVARVNRWTDEDKVDMFEASLTPGSPEFNAIAALGPDDKSTFDKMIAALKESSKPLRDFRVREYYRLQRNNGQSLDDLANKIIKKVAELYPEFSDEHKAKLVRDKFYSSLNEELVVALINSSSLKSVEEIKALSKSIEINLPKMKQSVKRASNDKNVQKCTTCNKLGHVAAVCWSKNKRGSKNNNVVPATPSLTPSSSMAPNVNSKKTNSKEVATINLSKFDVPRQFLKAKIDKRLVYCLIDNGAKISVFPLSFPAQKLESSSVFAANGSPIKIMGEAKVVLNFGGCTIGHKVLIGDVTKPMLGRDFIVKISATITADDIMYFTWGGNHHRVNLIAEDQIGNVNDHDLSESEVCALAIENLTLDNGNEESNDSEMVEVEIFNLIDQYKSLFEGIGRTDLIEHCIELKSNKIVNIKPYPVPYAYRDQVRTMLAEMLSEGIIERSSSEWCSPILALKKKDGSLRLAIDYRRLNAISKFDAHPTPKVSEILCNLDQAKIFSKLDFKSGYYQVPLRACDREKTAFRFENNLYHFRVMPFGLSTAAQTFTRLGNMLFQLPFVKIYIDDVIIFSKNINEHVGHLRQVFEILKSAKLTLNRKKCEFAKPQIEYLGFVISNGTIRPSPEKTSCVEKYPVPKTRKDLRSFLGLVNSYRNLIEKYADITADLYDLLKSNNRFVWRSCHQNVFDNLKRLMVAEPIVRIPDLNREFIVRTDASDKAMAGLLQQIDDNGNRYVVEYFSKKYTDCQSRYSTIEKEATALKTAIDKWAIYLKGKPFKLETDHRPLVWLKTMANRNNKLARMAIDLAEYQFEVSHVRGVDNCDADALSRIEISAVQFDELSSEQNNDELLFAARQKTPKSFVSINNLWYFRNAGRDRLCIPQSKVRDVLRLCHDQMNHIGVVKCLDLVYCRFYWPKWRNDVKQWIFKCECNLKKDNNPSPVKSPLSVTDILKLDPFEKVAVDIMTLSTTNSGNRYLFTLQDYRSKWIEAKASADSSAEQVILWLDEIWSRFGKPRILVSDCGSQFESREFQTYCSRLNIVNHRTSPYHHQSNGMVERAHRSIWNLLRVVVSDQHNDWDDHLLSVLRSYRNTIHAALGISPYEALYCRPPKIEADEQFPTRTVSRNLDQSKVKKYIDRMKKNYDDRNKTVDEPIPIGIKVLVNHPVIQVGRCQKLLPKNKGPFEVAEQLSSNSYYVKDGDGQLLKVHRDQIRITGMEANPPKIRKRGRPRGEV